MSSHMTCRKDGATTAVRFGEDRPKEWFTQWPEEEAHFRVMACTATHNRPPQTGSCVRVGPVATASRLQSHMGPPAS